MSLSHESKVRAYRLPADMPCNKALSTMRIYLFYEKTHETKSSNLLNVDYFSNEKLIDPQLNRESVQSHGLPWLRFLSAMSKTTPHKQLEVW
jgi:hypothetical protein